jgi:competence protein ComEA
MSQPLPTGLSPVPPKSEGPEWLRAWPWQARLAAAFLLGGITTLLITYSLASARFTTRPTDLLHGRESGFETRVDLNRADRAVLLQLPGVGPNLAQRIEDNRQQNGSFRNSADLTRVPGIGSATAERLRPWIRVGDEQPVPTPSTGKPKSGQSKKTLPAEPIDINQATAAELQMLPGIGPTRARQIIEARQKGLFESVDDLRRVSGIGPKTLERLRPYVKVEKPQRIAAAGLGNG